MVESLDMRGVACPINFVRSKIKIDTMQPGEVLEILLDDGEPIESVSLSMQEEGHKCLEKSQLENHWKLVIEKIL